MFKFLGADQTAFVNKVRAGNGSFDYTRWGLIEDEYNALKTLGFTFICLPVAKGNGVVYSQRGDNINIPRNSPASYMGPDGLIEYAGSGFPRLVYANSGVYAGLQVEEGSSNIIQNSDAGVRVCSVEDPHIRVEAPDGNITAVAPTSGANSHRFEDIIPAGTYQSGQTITRSWYRKIIDPSGSSVGGSVVITGLINSTQVGSVSQVDSDISGFDRFKAVFTVIDGSVNTLLRLYYGARVGIGNTSIAYWGHQIETEDKITSLIRTTANVSISSTSGSTVTTGAAVTRDSEIAILDNLQAKNYLAASVGTVFYEKDGNRIGEVYYGGNKHTYTNGAYSNTVAASVPTSITLAPGTCRAICLSPLLLTETQLINLTI